MFSHQGHHSKVRGTFVSKSATFGKIVKTSQKFRLNEHYTLESKRGFYLENIIIKRNICVVL